MKIQLISGWRTWWRWWSLRLESLGFFLAVLPTILDTLSTSILATWSTIPHEIKQTIPEPYIQTVGAIAFIAGVLARFIPQKKPTEAANGDREARRISQQVRPNSE